MNCKIINNQAIYSNNITKQVKTKGRCAVYCDFNFNAGQASGQAPR